MTRIERVNSRAYVLLSVLICLTLVMTLGTAWLRTIGLERAHIRADVLGAQAELLAASGLSRATTRLAGDTNYKGETWRVGADELDGAGAVTIKVVAVAEAPAARRIDVVAEYPSAGAIRVRRSRQAVHSPTLQNTREDNSP